MTERVRLYVDAALLDGDHDDAIATASELGFTTVVVEDRTAVPEDLVGEWYLSTDVPDAGSRRWSRTIVVGPRAQPGRRAVTGLRTARDLRLAVLELASEQAAG